MGPPVNSERSDTIHATQEAPAVKADGITQEQADAIGEILRQEYETNPAFRAVIDAKLPTPSLSGSPASPLAGEPPKGEAA